MCSSCGGGGGALPGQRAASPLLIGQPDNEIRAVKVLSVDSGIGQPQAIVSVTGDGVQALIDGNLVEQIGPSRSRARGAVKQDLWYVGPYAFPSESQARNYMQQTGLPMRKVLAGTSG